VPSSLSHLPASVWDTPSPTSHLLSSEASILKGLKVCFVAGTLGQGGAERQLCYILQTLRDARACAKVLSLSKGEFWESPIRHLGFEVSYVGGSPSRLKRLVRVIRGVRGFRPAVAQSQHFYTNGYAAIAGRCCGARTVGAVRNDGFNDLQDCGRLFGKLCLRLPHRLAANSQAAMRNLVSLGCRRENLFHLPNVIDLAQFRPAQSNNGELVTILGIGRLVPQKRFDRFLRVLALLQQSCTAPFKALIAGDGPLRPELERLARDSGLCPGTLKFCGKVPDVQSLYKKSYILLLTSDHEGTPNVVMEAMASGLPVVATAVGDVAELVQHGVTGFVVEPSDEEGAARHVANLMKGTCARESMGNRARAFIQAHYALECLPGYLARLYSEDLT
jgi:glycosyltransferase involved in cell wall biosynthesis